MGNGRYCLDFTPHSGYAPNGINFEVSGADPGNSSYTGDYCGVATIDEFRMYSGAMETAQIADVYASGPNSLPVPKLSIAIAGQNLVFTWPDYITGYSLQTSAKLGAGASWVPAAGSSYVLTNRMFSINVPMTNQQAFYRIVK